MNPLSLFTSMRSKPYLALLAVLASVAAGGGFVVHSFGATNVLGAISHANVAGFIRASRRIQIEAPLIPLDQLAQPPPDLPLQRPPRYAGKIGTGKRHYPGVRWK